MQVKPMTKDEMRDVYIKAQKITFEKWKQGIKETDVITEFARQIEERCGVK